jgi:hypothetical protein
MADAPDLIDRVHQFVLAALDFSRRLPNTPQARIAGEQFYRACAAAEKHYRAAQRAPANAGSIGKLVVVFEELDDAVGWLERLRDAGVGGDPVLLAEAEQLRATFGRALTIARRVQKAREQRERDSQALRSGQG